MSLTNLPDPKFKQGQTITNGEKTITIDFIEYDFEREEYYYYPMKYRFSQTIYESDAELTDPPKPHSLETFDILFGEDE
ncbi:hypothetical protein CK503_11245 [Aliifodinibius salipaludis]|uniref:Uncharacterized protein n=1 Tax=Fodinibius salipaludis TaxID=2032627 RepID=A0A2A2GA45_9BACT|nr:hypothetical protein [Aliifodinibius salipaludis]PAU93719.1 hypothetical protein CK503_11245 [Aliifodinibius salipaludis]